MRIVNNSYIQKLRARWLRPFVFVFTVSVVGAGILLLTKAATPVASIEAETGGRSGGAALVSDVAASGGSAVRFGNSAAPSGTWSSGAANDWNNAFGTWRGSRSTIVGCWADGDVGNQTNAWCFGDGPAWTYDVDLAPGFIVGGETLAQAASGAMDSRWRSAMQAVNAHWGSKRTAYIRPAHEMNGNYPWVVSSANAANFRAAWVRYYNIIQQELVQKGRNAKMVLSYNWSTAGGTGATIDEIWPGDQYVDVVGVDFYDVFWTGATSTDHYTNQAKWDTMMGWTDHHGPMGLSAWLAFARAHGKPVGFPEWGLSDHGGYDNPFFIQKMHDFLAANAGTGPGQVLYDIYFNVDGGYPGMQLAPTTASPNAAAMYRSLRWGHN